METLDLVSLAVGFCFACIVQGFLSAFWEDRQRSKHVDLTLFQSYLSDYVAAHSTALLCNLESRTYLEHQARARLALRDLLDHIREYGYKGVEK